MDLENKYGTRATQEVLLSMMKILHAFLEKEEISYCLAYGSLLGAVRHRGFIPWDDDMDIMVDRENYEKILKNFDRCKGLKLRKIQWITRVKREGLEKSPMIDIFVWDEVPKNVFFRKGKLLLIKMLQGMLKDRLVLSRNSAAYKVCVVGTFVLGRFFSTKLKQRMYEFVSQIGGGSGLICSYNSDFRDIHTVLPARLMTNFSKSFFEDTEFFIPTGFDSFLNAFYGDYMTLPDEKKRFPIHNPGI